MLGVIGVVIQAGSMNFQEIIVRQNSDAIFGWDGLGNPYVLTQFVGFVVFMIAVQAELTQPPFDMPIAESELVSGYMTEYSGFRFLIFFIAEFATVGVFSLIAAALFLGGWGVPFAWFGWDSIDEVDDWMNLAGPLIMFTKMMALSFIVMWVRFSFPRFREDQLQRFAWKVLIPVAVANIVVTATFKVASVNVQLRATRRQPRSGQQRPAWPGNAIRWFLMAWRRNPRFPGCSRGSGSR